MIFHEECALNIEHTLYKGSDFVVVGWVKGDAALNLVFNGVDVPHGILVSERPDVAAYFGIDPKQCYGFVLYSTAITTEMHSHLALRLTDKNALTSGVIPVGENSDPATVLQVVDALKGKGIPDDLFLDGTKINGLKFTLGAPADRRHAVGHIEVVKLSKTGNEALVVGWAVAKSPNDFILKMGGDLIPYDRLFAYPRPDIEEPFSKTFGQNARTSGFIAFFTNLQLNPDEPIQLMYARKGSKTLHPVAATTQLEKGVSFEDMQAFLKGIYTPDISLGDRVLKVDGPLAYSALTGLEDHVYFTRPDVVLGKADTKPITYLAVVVPKGFTGDVLQSVMAFVALNPTRHRLQLSFFFRDVVASSQALRDVADRANAVFDAPVMVHNACTHLSLGHISYSVNQSGATNCYVIDARSGFEYQAVSKSKKMDVPFNPSEITMFFSRDVNGISGTHVTFDMLNSLCSNTARTRTANRPAFSKNKVFAMAMSNTTLASLAQDMGFMKADELSDIELLVRRSDKLSAKYTIDHVKNGLPFAKISQANMQFHDTLGRQVEMYTMAQVGV